jgi:hypothetical protein
MMSNGLSIEESLNKLTMPDKIKLLAGLGMWHTQPIPDASIPSMRMSDGLFFYLRGFVDLIPDKGPMVYEEPVVIDLLSCTSVK